MSYDGSERRRHRVYVTRNTEYHLRDGICVAVRDRVSGRFRPSHSALSRKVEGGVKIHDNGAVVPHLGEPGVGDALYFACEQRSEAERQLVTSRIESIGRPPKRDVLMYGRAARL